MIAFSLYIYGEEFTIRTLLLFFSPELTWHKAAYLSLKLNLPVAVRRYLKNRLLQYIL